MKLIAYCAVYNEYEYVDYAIRSTIDYVDRFIIIEGSWGENVIANGTLRSNDGTIEILERLQKEYPDKIEIHHLNGKNQIEQRSFIFNYLNEDCCMLLQDADEVYSREEIEAVKVFINNTDFDCVSIRSNTFVNDFYHYIPFDFARLFRIRKDHSYKFIHPNTIICDNKPMSMVKTPNLSHHHYSYVKSQARFMEKKRERVLVHGKFEWENNGDIIRRQGVEMLEYKQEHPSIMKTHSMWGVKKHENREPSEIICFMQHSGIGNLIHTIPCLKAIRSIKPTANIYVLTWGRSVRILDGSIFIDLVIGTDNKIFLQSLGRKVDHMIISPVGASFNGNLEDYCKDIMTHNVTPPWGKHEVEVNMDFARRLGYSGETPSNEIVLFDYNKVNAEKFLSFHKIKEKFIAINASYLKQEHWPFKHFGNIKYAELLNLLVEKYKDYSIIFLGHKNDIGDAQEIINLVKQKDNISVVNGCGFSEDIKDTCAVIRKASLVVGNDGAISHIAAALQVPSVTIFTFTNIIKNRPVGPKSKIVAVPCEKRIMCQHNANKLMECKNKGCFDVKVEEVIRSIEGLLDV